MRKRLTTPRTVTIGTASTGENNSARTGVIVRLRPNPAKPLMKAATSAVTAPMASSGESRSASGIRAGPAAKRVRFAVHPMFPGGDLKGAPAAGALAAARGRARQ